MRNSVCQCECEVIFFYRRVKKKTIQKELKMSSGGQFCLRWNNHQPNMVSVFSSLMQNDQLVDVTLLAENNEIHAHKIVLSACSPYFQVKIIGNRIALTLSLLYFDFDISPFARIWICHFALYTFWFSFIHILSLSLSLSFLHPVAFHSQSMQASCHHIGRREIYVLEKSRRIYVQR